MLWTEWHAPKLYAAAMLTIGSVFIALLAAHVRLSRDARSGRPVGER